MSFLFLLVMIPVIGQKLKYRAIFFFTFLCCVACFVCLRLVCPMLPVSLDCPFLIVPLVFSNVYVKSLEKLKLKAYSVFRSMIYMRDGKSISHLLHT